MWYLISLQPLRLKEDKFQKSNFHSKNSNDLSFTRRSQYQHALASAIVKHEMTQIVQRPVQSWRVLKISELDLATTWNNLPCIWTLIVPNRTLSSVEKNVEIEEESGDINWAF